MKKADSLTKATHERLVADLSDWIEELTDRGDIKKALKVARALENVEKKYYFEFDY